MLQQELALLDSRPVDGASGWLVPAIAISAALTGAAVLWIAGASTAAVLFLGLSAVAFPAALYFGRSRGTVVPDLDALVAAPDY